jgi:hypothetical protein
MMCVPLDYPIGVNKEIMDMAHHHSPNRPLDEGKESRDFRLHSSDSATPNVNHSSRKVETEKEDVPPHEKKKSILEYQIAGFPWPFALVMSIIVIGFLGLVLTVAGVF